MNQERDRPRGMVAIVPLPEIGVVMRGICYNEFSAVPQKCADLASVIYQLREPTEHDDGSPRR